jgi:hypothetical protein
MSDLERPDVTDPVSSQQAELERREDEHQERRRLVRQIVLAVVLAILLAARLTLVGS